MSEAISKVAKIFNIDTPNATVHRKVVSTETKKHKKESIQEMCDQMSHSRATCERFYSRTSNEQSFSVQTTIEELCSNKYFTHDQSELIKLEWPLHQHTIPLALCRDLPKKYKHLSQKTDKQIQDHWNYLKNNICYKSNTACIIILMLYSEYIYMTDCSEKLTTITEYKIINGNQKN